MSSDNQETEIEGLESDLLAVGKASRWEQFRLPVELHGRSFLDVGCWEGVHCADAVRRGAETVVGVDICTCKDLSANVDRYGFEFLQMDVFGDLWQGLDRFDVVLCSGLIYSVPNPMALLMRLRSVVGDLLVIETASTTLGGDEPMTMFQGDEAGNPSNWWIPNRACIESMLATAGFSGISTVWEEGREEHWGRLCVQAVPSRGIDRGRLLPRKARLMSVNGGNRGGRGGRARRNPDA
jgi:SAM-dependent methyltransferase